MKKRACEDHDRNLHGLMEVSRERAGTGCREREPVGRGQKGNGQRFLWVG